MSNNFPTNKHEWLAPTYNFLRALWAWISGSPNVDFWQADAYVATNVAATYANGTVGVGATLTKATAGAFPTVDGVVAKRGNVYLLGGQTTKYQNGLYQLTTLGSTSVAFVLTRVSGFDVAADFTAAPASPVVFVRLGATTYGGTVWEYTGGASPTMGSTSLTFAQAQIQREARQEWDPVKVLDATVLNLTDYTYTAATQILTANATGALGAMDGQTMAVGDRVVRNVSDVRDGIYSISNLGGSSDYAVFTRTADANTSAEFTDGKIVSIARGSVYGGTLYECNVAAAFTLDTDTPTWTKTAVGVTWAATRAALAAASSSVPFNGQKGTGLANGTAASDAAAFGQIPTGAAAQTATNAAEVCSGHVYYDAPIVAELITISADAALSADGARTILTSPGIPRGLAVRVTIDTTHAVTAGALNVVGIGPSGEAVTEAISLITAVSATVNSNNAFAKVTSATVAGLVQTGGAGNDSLSIGVSAKMGLVGNKTPASGTWVLFKTSVDAVDETVAGLDATYGTVSPTSAANASRKFKFFYNYSVTPTQNSHTHTLA